MSNQKQNGGFGFSHPFMSDFSGQIVGGIPVGTVPIMPGTSVTHHITSSPYGPTPYHLGARREISIEPPQNIHPTMGMQIENEHGVPLMLSPENPGTWEPIQPRVTYGYPERTKPLTIDIPRDRFMGGPMSPISPRSMMSPGSMMSPMSMMSPFSPMQHKIVIKTGTGVHSFPSTDAGKLALQKKLNEVIDAINKATGKATTSAEVANRDKLMDDPEIKALLGSDKAVIMRDIRGMSKRLKATGKIIRAEKKTVNYDEYFTYKWDNTDKLLKRSFDYDEMKKQLGTDIDLYRDFYTLLTNLAIANGGDKKVWEDYKAKSLLALPAVSPPPTTGTVTIVVPMSPAPELFKEFKDRSYTGSCILLFEQTHTTPRFINKKNVLTLFGKMNMESHFAGQHQGFNVIAQHGNVKYDIDGFLTKEIIDRYPIGTSGYTNKDILAQNAIEQLEKDSCGYINVELPAIKNAVHIDICKNTENKWFRVYLLVVPSDILKLHNFNKHNRNIHSDPATRNKCDHNNMGRIVLGELGSRLSRPRDTRMPDSDGRSITISGTLLSILGPALEEYGATKSMFDEANKQVLILEEQNVSVGSVVIKTLTIKAPPKTTP